MNKRLLMAFFALPCALWASEPESCGKKHDNLVNLQKICRDEAQVKIPPFFGITSSRVEQFLRTHAPAVFQEYADIIKNNAFMTNSAALDKIHTLIKEAFKNYPFTFTAQETQFLADSAQNNTFLMVRSTGIEDSQNAANAGGNASIAYVEPTVMVVQQAMGEVVASYFGIQSLKNRYASGENIAQTPLCLPVLIQQLIGESADGVVPVSGVAYSTNTTLSGAQFAVTEINAAYGHGEGVVANRVHTDRFYVVPALTSGQDELIYTQVHDKKFRLVPQHDKNHELGLFENPRTLAQAPALSEQNVKQLYRALKKVEAAYGHAVDVEFVVKNGTIYIVQARPAMHPKIEPSYTTTAEHAAIVQQFSCITLVPGALKAQIEELQDMLITNTLDEADQHITSAQAHAVVVGAWASSLSHAAVNFISHSTPALYVPEFQAFKNACQKWQPTYRLIIDTQKQRILIWDTAVAPAEQAIASGWYQLPLNACFSYTAIPAHAPLDNHVLPRDAKLMQLFEKLITDPAHAQEYVTQLDQLVRKTFALTKKQITLKSAHIAVDHYQKVFAAVEQRWEQAIKEYQAALTQPQAQQRKLFFQAVIRSIIAPENGDGVIAGYGYNDCLNELLALQTTCTFKKQFGQDALLADLLPLAEQAPCKELEHMWKQYINALEKAHKTAPEKRATLETFKTMVHELAQSGHFALWLATDLPAAHGARDIWSALDGLIKAHKGDNSFFGFVLSSGRTQRLHELQQLEQQLHVIHGRIASCSTQRDWIDLHAQLRNFIQTHLVSSAFASKFGSDDALCKLVAGRLLSDVIDTTDTLIKTMKMSTLAFEDKKENFKNMIADFYNLSVYLLKEIMPENALTYHESWPLNGSYSSWGNYHPGYLATQKDCLDRLYWDRTEDESDRIFKKSENFSVNAAVIGAGTAFERHYPETAEDHFMLAHQNSLAALSGALNSAASKLFLPAMLKDIMNTLESDEGTTLFTQHSCQQPKRIGIAYSATGIVVTYNISLRNHSSRLLVHYDKVSDICSIEMQLVGQSRDRWQDVHFFAHLTPELAKLSLEESVLDVAGGCVTVRWRVMNQQEIQGIMKCCAYMGELSFENGVRYNALTRFCRGNNSRLAIQCALAQLMKQKEECFPSRISGIQYEISYLFPPGQI